MVVVEIITSRAKDCSRCFTLYNSCEQFKGDKFEVNNLKVINGAKRERMSIIREPACALWMLFR